MFELWFMLQARLVAYPIAPVFCSVQAVEVASYKPPKKDPPKRSTGTGTR